MGWSTSVSCDRCGLSATWPGPNAPGSSLAGSRTTFTMKREGIEFVATKALCLCYTCSERVWLGLGELLTATPSASLAMSNVASSGEPSSEGAECVGVGSGEPTGERM